MIVSSPYDIGQWVRLRRHPHVKGTICGFHVFSDETIHVEFDRYDESGNRTVDSFPECDVEGCD